MLSSFASVLGLDNNDHGGAGAGAAGSTSNTPLEDGDRQKEKEGGSPDMAAVPAGGVDEEVGVEAGDAGHTVTPAGDGREEAEAELQSPQSQQEGDNDEEQQQHDNQTKKKKGKKKKKKKQKLTRLDLVYAPVATPDGFWHTKKEESNDGTTNAPEGGERTAEKPPLPENSWTCLLASGTMTFLTYACLAFTIPVIVLIIVLLTVRKAEQNISETGSPFKLPTSVDWIVNTTQKIMP